jgi:hypothetical protein
MMMGGDFLPVHLEWSVNGRSTLSNREAYIRTAALCPWHIIPNQIGGIHGLGSTIRGDDLFRRAESMLRNCVRNPTYQSADQDPNLPSRTIDVSFDKAHLQLMSGRGLRAKYVCLSHFWGNKQPLTTTTANLSQHFKSLSWDDIPVIYQECIELSRVKV